jgi:hypothetical protein
VARSAALASDLCDDGPIEAKPYRPQRLAERIKTALDQVRRAGNEPVLLPRCKLKNQRYGIHHLLSGIGNRRSGFSAPPGRPGSR